MMPATPFSEAPLTIWESNPEAVTELSVEQIVSAAGDGKLRDESDCSRELRQYLSEVSTDRLAAYAEHCLGTPFPKSGHVLQDVINELGRRLEYKATNGRYQGTSNVVGFDGIWVSPEGTAIVVEVKTSDAYRIALDRIANYRDRLQDDGRIARPATILIVVGREDTGELEAQVRGSRHAWDMRLISVDALLALVRIKESTDSGVSGTKIRSILVPMEYTRLDGLVDVMFATAKDVEAAADIEKPSTATESEGDEASGWEFTPSNVIQAIREAIISALGARDGKRLIKRSRALYWDADHTYRVACTVSKRYEKRGATPYWYAYHPSWDEFLGEGDAGWFVLGCVDRLEAFAIPVQAMRHHLPQLNTTTNPDGGRFWHIKLQEPSQGQYALQLPIVGSSLPLAEYRIALPTDTRVLAT
jgi:hypothetical protein